MFYIHRKNQQNMRTKTNSIPEAICPFLVILVQLATESHRQMICFVATYIYNIRNLLQSCKEKREKERDRTIETGERGRGYGIKSWTSVKPSCLFVVVVPSQVLCLRERGDGRRERINRGGRRRREVKDRRKGRSVHTHRGRSAACALDTN